MPGVCIPLHGDAKARKLKFSNGCEIQQRAGFYHPPLLLQLHHQRKIVPRPVEGRAGRGVKQLKRKYTLRFDQIKNQWALKHDATDKTIKIFKSKEDSTRAGVLRKALGKLGGTVIIRTKTGTLDEERNFPEQP